MEFVFAGIPVWGDVAFFAAENHQCVHSIAALLPNGISPCHMRREHATASIQFERNVIGIQAFGGHSHQNAQRVGLDDLVHKLWIFDRKVGWDVHRLNGSLKNLMTGFSGDSGLP
jgi:hypothetical protein